MKIKYSLHRTRLIIQITKRGKKVELLMMEEIKMGEDRCDEKFQNLYIINSNLILCIYKEQN